MQQENGENYIMSTKIRNHYQTLSGW